ncbi:MAG: hypothetical protein FWH26_00065 [Oscillospiraceae bacterium]|nr:hypothetical protein [Oscillospiraceae bacterium]
MTKPDFVGAYTKEQQKKNREIRAAGLQKSAQRSRDTRRKIILGGILLKYFPELKELDPAVESDFKAVVGIFAALASDPEFLKWWAGMMKKGQRESPASPD